MKKKLLVFSIIALFVFCIKANAQESEVKEKKEVLSHTVELGETVMMIAKKYLVRPKDIYDLNPDAVEGIHQNMVLKIPADKIKVKLSPEQKNKIKTEIVTIKGNFD